MRARFIVVLAFFCCLSGTALAKDVVFAVDATYPPMEMLDADKNVVGFAPELVMAIGKAAGFTPILKNTAWDIRLRQRDEKLRTAQAVSV